LSKTIKQDLKVGDSITFDNGRIEITILKKSGQIARLDIKAESDVILAVSKAGSSASAIAKNGLTMNKP
jgi:S-adenosylmethionine:tRNA-ribosyltransferase-isomerase (queuine synthetase)